MDEVTEILKNLDWSPLYISLKTGVAATVISFFLGIFAAGKAVKASPGKKAVLDGILTLPMVLSDEDITARVSEIASKERVVKKKPKVKKYDDVDIAQMSLFDTVKDDDVLEELKNLDVGNMTPIDALNTIYRLQNKLKNRW